MLIALTQQTPGIRGVSRKHFIDIFSNGFRIRNKRKMEFLRHQVKQKYMCTLMICLFLLIRSHSQSVHMGWLDDCVWITGQNCPVLGSSSAQLCSGGWYNSARVRWRNSSLGHRVKKMRILSFFHHKNSHCLHKNLPLGVNLMSGTINEFVV